MLLLDQGAIARMMQSLTGQTDPAQGPGLFGDPNDPTHGPMNGAMPAPQGPPQGPPPQAQGMSPLPAPVNGAAPNGILAMLAAGGSGAPTGSRDPAQGPPRGLLDRIGGALGGDTAPAGMESLFSPEDLKAVHTSLPGKVLNMLFGASPRDVTNMRLSELLQNRQTATALQMQATTRARRAALAQQFAAPTDHQETDDETRNRLLRFYTAAMTAGDPELVKGMSEHLAALMPKDAPAKKDPMQVKGVISDGSVNPAFKGKTVDQLVDPVSGQVVKEMLAGASPMSDDAKAFREASLRMQAQGQTDANERSAASRALTESNAFDREAKNYTDFVPKYQNFMNALDQAKHQNEAAYRTVLLNYMNSEATTPGRGQLGILKYLSDMDPSIGGRIKIAGERLSKGTFPLKVLQNMEAHIAGKYATFGAQYDRLRAERVKNNTRLANILPSTQTVFPDAAPVNTRKITLRSGKTVDIPQ